MVWLVRCNGKSAGAGGLINGGNTMLFLCMIDGINTMLLHLAGRWWEGTLATRLVSSSLSWLTVWLLRCNGESAGMGRLINGGNTILFLGMIDSGNTTLLHSAGWWWEGGNTGHVLGAFFSWLVNCLASLVQQQISGCRQTDQQWQHNAFSWYDQRWQHDATSVGWLMVGGREQWPHAWCDRQNSEARRNKTL